MAIDKKPLVQPKPKQKESIESFVKDSYQTETHYYCSCYSRMRKKGSCWDCEARDRN